MGTSTATSRTPARGPGSRLLLWIGLVWGVLVLKSLLLQWLVHAYEVDAVGPLYIGSVGLIAGTVITLVLVAVLGRGGR